MQIFLLGLWVDVEINSMYVQLFSFTMIFFAAIGFARGFMKEALGLLGFFLFFYVTFHFSDEVAAMFLQSSGPVAKILFNIFFCFIAFILISVLNSMISKSLKGLNLNLFFDHFCGILIGTLKGFSLALIVTIPLIFGAETIQERAEKYEITLPDSLLIEENSIFLHMVAVLQGKILIMADVKIEEKIETFFDIMFAINKKDKNEESNARKIKKK